MIPQLIDTVKISLSSDSLLIPSLDRIKETKSDYGLTISGNYRNLFISKHNNSVSISGSLPKFSRNETMTFEEVKKSIYGLCETFSFEPEEARLQRVDIASTIKTIYEPTSYFQYLGTHSRYFRSPFKNSLYYTNSIRKLNFYDKAKEQNIIGNLLRYEQRYFKPETVFKKPLLLADLLTEEVYKHFLSNWKADYNRIQKAKTLIPMENFKTPTDFYNYLMAIASQQIGNETLSNQLKLAQRSGAINKQNAKRIRDKMSRLSKSKLFEANELILELDEKINKL